MRVKQANLINRIKMKYPEMAASIDTISFDWYKIRNVADAEGNPSDTTEVFIYDEIGGPCSDLQANEFVQELNDITTPKIVCRINSPGGSLFDGIAIYNALAQHPAHVTTRIDGIAASAASIIAMAGQRVEIGLGAEMMIHDALAQEIGNAREMRETADFLDKQSDNIASVYAAKSDRFSKAEWRNLMLDETWMFADETVNVYGLADAVYIRPKGDPETLPGTVASDDREIENRVDEEKVLANLMAFDHVRAGATHRYKHTDREHSGGTSTPRNSKSFTDLWKD